MEIDLQIVCSPRTHMWVREPHQRRQVRSSDPHNRLLLISRPLSPHQSRCRGFDIAHRLCTWRQVFRHNPLRPTTYVDGRGEKETARSPRQVSHRWQRRRCESGSEHVKLTPQKDRQVGNMINVNLSRALHAHIHREVFFKAWLEMGKPDNFLERWRDQHPI